MSASLDVKDKRASRTVEVRALLVFATVLFGLSVRASSPKAGLAVAFATFLIAAALWIGRHGTADTDQPHRQELRLFLVIVVFAVFGLAGWAPWSADGASQLLERIPFAVFGLLGCLLYLGRGRFTNRRPIAAVAATTVVLTVVVGVLHLGNTSDFGVDVFWLHRAAAEAIAVGQNPYTDAVQVENGAPTSKPGDMIVGYPYPPVTALAYSIAEWTAGDARYASLMSWAGLLALLGWRAYRRHSHTYLYVMLLLASIPGWPLVLRAGWTEPFSLLLLTGAFLIWRRPSRSGALTGLALASKQYFAAALPVLLLHREEGWKRRLIYTAALVSVAILPVFLLDPAAFWDAAVDFHLNTPWRHDSVNISGVFAAFGTRWAPPRWLGPLIGIGVGVLAGRLSRGRKSFFLGMAVTLAAVFLISSQALANYWFLIVGLCSLALLPEEGSESAAGESQPAKRASISSGSIS